MVRPNIVLMMTDTQPTEIVGCYSGHDVQTPELDDLAARGVRFTHAYTSSPLCTPARAGIFTGMMPSRAGAYTNSVSLGDGIQTMGQRLSTAGYRTAYIGKWHLDGHDYFGTGTCPPGWEADYWYDGRNYLDDLTAEQVASWRRGMYRAEDLRDNGITSEFTWAHRISDRAEQFLAGHDSDERPFLLVASYDEPHHPWTCPPEYVERFTDVALPVGPSAFDDLDGKPEHHRVWADGWAGISNPTGELRQPLMLGCNSYVDSQIGRVARAARSWAKRTGRPTWVIYTSDHGDHLGTHRLMAKGPTGYEANVHIPFIVVPPDDRSAGTVQPSVVSHLDILPSLLELAGEPCPATLDGRSFLDLIGNERLDGDRAVVAEYTRYELGHDGFGGLEPLRMYVRWPWKLVINLHRTDELYDLDADPDELHNRIGDPETAEVRDQLHDALLEWMDDHVDPQRGVPWQRRAWRDASRPTWNLGAPMRPVRDDGVRPPYLDYDSGRPTTGPRGLYS